MMTNETQQSNRFDSTNIGFWLGPVLAVCVLLPSGGELKPEAQYLAAFTVLMATWWMSEAIPIAVTALIPLALFPMAGINPAATVAKAYGHDLIWLFFGGFQLAFAVERCGLHRCMALRIVGVFGTGRRNSFLASCLLLGCFRCGSSTHRRP